MARSSIKARVLVSFAIFTIGVFLVLSVLLLRDNLESSKAFAGENLIRLHVVAHSNAPKDQDLKLKVRDAVLQDAHDLIGTSRDKAQIQALLRENKSRLEELAQAVVRAHGFEYPVQVKIGNFAFPPKDYGTLSLPEGWYDAVRIELGAALGDNWWCILFPPLCLADLEGASTNLVKVEPKTEAEPRIVLRSRLWDHFAQTRYAQTLQKWWQASAASYPMVSN